MTLIDTEKEEKKRKRRKELSPKRKSKRGRSDPEETERIRQNLEELNLRRTEEREALKEAGAEGTANPVINATAYIEAFERLQALTHENVEEAVTLILQYGKLY